jgi:hypothetical protein
VPGLHFHDLRHTGTTLAARTGASTKELMARMGHDSAQAAMIYQHATSEADRAVAKAVDEAVKKVRKATKKAATRKPRKGTPGPTPETDKPKHRRHDEPDDGAGGALVRRA